MLKIGMYVRCPFDFEAVNSSEVRTFYMGQITEINEDNNTVHVVFHDPLRLRDFFAVLPDEDTFRTKAVKHVPALLKTMARFKNGQVKILSISHYPDDEKPFYQYYVEYFKNGRPQIGEVSEAQIEIPFTRANYNPANQMLHYELQNPKWYMQRRIVSNSLNIIDNAPNGFKNLLGTRVHLFTHQVDTIVRALSESPCRLMLADEVGLGKTIEALSIIKGMTDRRPALKSLIIVPESLIYQWQNELSYKFWMDAPIWDKYTKASDAVTLISTSEFEQSHQLLLQANQFDMIVVDETHKLLSNASLYQSILKLCKETENLLLLSATPILHREEEYHKLLTLLNPQRFESMPISEFNALLSKQKTIRDIVFNLMRDIPDYAEYNLFADFIDSLEEIYDEIEDDKLRHLIDEADQNAPDKGLSSIKLALSYISEFYQIERGIIRHRRAEIAGTNIERTLIELPYEMAGSDIGVYESNCYHAVLDYVQEQFENQSKIPLGKRLLAATFSSPYALLQEIKSVQPDESIGQIIHYANLWKLSLDAEIASIQNVVTDIDAFNSKFAKIIDFIDLANNSKSKKFLIFTGFTETAKNLERCFTRFFGEYSTCAFHYGMTGEEMQESASLFQNEASYRFMICDESGGEGRNFQMADYIIHCDLPWSPALLEQRIGRLDRIGRESGKNVTSIVCHSEDTLEQDLFRIYDTGLNIFNASLCGMEIAFEQIHETIETALQDDVQFGLSHSVDRIKAFAEEMNDEIERERYYDLARQLDLDLQEKIGNLIHHFSDNDGAELMNTMLAWPALAGFKGISVRDSFDDGGKVVSIHTAEMSEASMLNSLYFPPRMDTMIRKSKFKNDIRGTFSRSTAVKHENLAFFGPYNPLFDSITANAEECYKGRCGALKFTDSGLNYIGLLYTWNIQFNPNELYKKGYAPELIALISQYLPNKQVGYVKSAYNKYSEISTEQVLDALQSCQRQKPVHLGKRDNGAINQFTQKFPADKWEVFVKKGFKQSKKFALEQAVISMDSSSARKELENILLSNRAKELFYGYADSSSLLHSEKEIDALVYGLEHPRIDLDSVAFVVLEE